MAADDARLEIRRLEDHYGFSRNPYDPAPLLGTEEEARLFVGREAERRELGAFLASFDHGALFVEGGVGVGKTTFVNVTEYQVARSLRVPRLLAGRSAVQLPGTLGSMDFLLSVLSTGLDALRRARPALERDGTFRELTTVVDQTIVRTRSFQGSVGGFGAGYGAQVTQTQPQALLLGSIGRRLDEFTALSARSGFDRIVVNVDNLELVEAGAFASFMDVMRDWTLNRVPFLWVFVGPSGARANLTERSRRVSELVRGNPVTLRPLAKAEVHSAIDRRVRRFGGNAARGPPLPPEVIDLLYDASGGEVRYIFNRATDLLLRVMLEFPTAREIDPKLAGPLLHRLAVEAVVAARLTDAQRELLGRLAVARTAQPREFATFGFRTPQAFHKALGGLHRKGLLERIQQGRTAVYSPRGDAVLALVPA